MVKNKVMTEIITLFIYLSFLSIKFKSFRVLTRDAIHNPGSIKDFSSKINLASSCSLMKIDG